MGWKNRKSDKSMRENVNRPDVNRPKTSPGCVIFNNCQSGFLGKIMVARMSTICVIWHVNTTFLSNWAVTAVDSG